MLELKEINRENYDKVIKLSVHDEQKSFIASNMYSLAQAKACPECIPLAIYSSSNLVGFIMFCLDVEDNEYWIYRLMIDKTYQGKGYGKEAMNKAISLIKEDINHHILYISFEQENNNAKLLYESLGFVADGRILGDEIVYCLKY